MQTLKGWRYRINGLRADFEQSHNGAYLATLHSANGREYLCGAVLTTANECKRFLWDRAQAYNAR